MSSGLLRSLLVASALCFSGAVRAQQDLFVPAEDSFGPLAVTQERMLSALEANPAYSDVRLIRIRPNVLQTAAVVRVGNVLVELGRREGHADGSFSWSSSASSQANGLFAVRGNVVVGDITSRDGVRHAIRPLSGGLHAYAKLRPRSLPQEHPPEADDGGGARPLRDAAPFSPPLALSLGAANGEPIGVIVPYTPEVAAGTADPALLARLSVDQANASYVQSGVAVQLELVHTYQTSTLSAGDMGLDLQRLRTHGDRYFDEVRDLRYSKGGDLVVLLGPDSVVYGTCGLATGVSADDASAFAVVAYDCATASYSFAHEVGHLQGARHNPENDGASSPFAYGHGTTDTANGFRTVMGYNRAACPDGWCEKLLSWSSPDVLHQGLPTGDADVRDNARVLRETAAGIAAFRTSGPPPSIVASAARMDIEVRQGQEQAVSLHVTNGGSSPLHWESTLRQDMLFPNQDGSLSPARGYAGYSWRSNVSHPDDVLFDWDVPPADARALRGQVLHTVDFGMTLFGCYYDRFDVGPEGDLYFRRPASLPVGESDPACPDAGAYGARLAPFEGVLLVPHSEPPPGSLVVWEPQSGEFVVQWSRFTSYEGTGEFTFQVHLSEDGGFRYQYLTMRPPFGGADIWMHDGRTDIFPRATLLDAGELRDGVVIQAGPSPPWVTLLGEPRLLAGGERQSLTLDIDARRLRLGTYSAEIALSSPNEVVRDVRVPITLTVVEDVAAVPSPNDGLLLGLPSPNPSRDDVQTTLVLTEPVDVSVTVLDVMGREVARLADGPLAPGTHLLTWNSTEAAAGVYVIRLVTSEGVGSRRVTILR